MRETWTGLLEAHAECETCGWQTRARTALGLAAQHHDRYRHVVHVTQTTTIRYGGGDRNTK